MSNTGEGNIFSPCCISLDLEVSRESGRIHGIGAVRGDTGRRLAHSGGGLVAALAKLDDLANGASFILGHNLIAFDLPHLSAAKPDLRLLKLPAIDTLRLSPLAFPSNPYHHLVKHYQDGGLKRGRINDPELDSRLALEVFGDQQRALKRVAPTFVLKYNIRTRSLADPGVIEDGLAVENDVVPFDRADVLEQGCVNAFLGDSPRSPRPCDLLACQLTSRREDHVQGVYNNDRLARR